MRITNNFFDFCTQLYFDTFQELFEKEKLDNKSLEETEVIKKLKRLLIADNMPLIKTLPKGTKLFRCRKLGIENGLLNTKNIFYDKSNNLLTGYGCYDSKEPPITISPEGRNNVSGVSYLYLAEDEYTACAEMRPDNQRIISLAKFEIKNDLKIFDFSTRENLSEYDDTETMTSATWLLSKIMSIFYLPVTDKKGYLISQYISDLVRKYGFDGICYLSSMTFQKSYTIFNCNDNNVEFIGSELVKSYVARYDLYKINDASCIEPRNEKIRDVTTQDIQIIKENLIRSIEERTKDNGQA